MITTASPDMHAARNLPLADPTINASTVSWGAIAAGAAGAAALSLILLILGTGLGLSSVSPWAREGISSSALGVSTILWLTLTQVLASGMGGYLAGRLRTRWEGLDPDEVYFRDTAHGFLAWAIASLATATLLTSVIGSIVGTGIQAGSSAVGGMANTVAIAAAGPAAAAGVEAAKASDTDTGAMGYFLDSLFRKDSTTSPAMTTSTGVIPSASGGASTAEIARILMKTVRTGALAPADLKYIGQAVSQRTGLGQVDAEKRVTDTYARMQAQLQEAEAAARQAADKARKASAYGALWLVVSLLMGAFAASWAGTFGGRRRDA